MLRFIVFTWLLSCSSSKEPQTGGLSLELNTSEQIATVIHIETELLENSQQPTAYRVTASWEGLRFQSEAMNLELLNQFTIVGAPPSSEVSVIVEAYDESNSISASAEASISTGTLPDELRAIDLQVAQDEQFQGFLYGTIFSDPAHLVLIDRKGRIVWGLEHGDELHGGIDSLIANDPQLGKTGFYLNWFNKNKEIDDSRILRVNWDGIIERDIRTPMAHHVFTKLPDQSLLYLALDIREDPEHGQVCGDRIVRQYLDGSEEVLFSTWDHIPLEISSTWNFNMYFNCRDWTHGNFIQYNAKRDSLIVSFVGPDIIYELSTTGEILSQWGGIWSGEKQSNFEPVDSTFSYAHGINWGRDDELMMISTRDDLTTAISYAPSDSPELETSNAGELTEQWRWGEDYEHISQHLGEVKDYGQHLRMINWGSVGHLQMITTAGAIQWEAHAEIGRWFAQFEYLRNPPNLTQLD